MSKGLTEIRSLARSHSESAIATLAGIMRQENAPLASRVAAANSLLDRGWGKPRQVATDDAAQPVKVEYEIVRTIVDPKAPLEEAARQQQLEDASGPVALIEASAVDPDA
jgi:hypothetical protein